ncbi:MAG: mannose-1-phosphate guanylyltransferase [Acidobacteria bacterium]|nr:mannose-1-phosphate guanylyltransferase [Acidobacteriota bacterium]
MRNLFAVIMAGGRSERFWPLGSEQRPKPFIPLLGPNTLFQATVSRVRPLIPPERILIAIGETHQALAAEQAPEIPPDNFILEPFGRDTAPCLGWSALHIERRDPEGIMIALPADHFIAEPERFRITLEKALRSLPGATGIVFGIRPDRAETGYGYIRAEKPAVPADTWPVVRFVEKPDSATAASYVQSGRYLWNSGMFLWRNRTLLELFQRHMPDAYSRLAHLRPLVGLQDRRDEIREIFGGFRRTSIDYGILEKTSGLRLIPADYSWDDIGNWSSLGRAVPADAGGNITRGPVTTAESRDCVVLSDSAPVAVFGATGLVVVRARDRVLVCPKERAPDLKKLLSALPEEMK